MLQRLNRASKRVPKGVLVYLLAGYVLLQFTWWAFMLADLNAEIHELKLQILQYSDLSATEFQIRKKELDTKLSTRIWMVLGEGSVFMMLLISGFLTIKRTISKELQLAKQQKNFLLSITHELKSPLAAIKLQLQTLITRDLKDAQRDQLYKRALNDADRLEKLVENLLLVNKVESNKMPILKESLNLSALITDLIENSYHNELNKKILSTEIEDGIMLRGDSVALQSVASNLLDNAFKYGGGGPVLISLKSGEKIELKVRDSGPGISNDEKQRVFERFYRLGSEATRTSKGTGIGLYLVRLLVIMHGGDITVSDNSPTGACFTVSFPQVAL